MIKDQKKPQELTEPEKNEITQSLQKFGNSVIEIERLFDLFSAWQSLKTRSLKRFVISSSLFFSLSFLLKLDITRIDLFGFNFEDADPFLFQTSLLVILSGSYLYYLFQRSIDKNVKQAKISALKDDLNHLIQLSDLLEKYIAKSQYKNIRSLISKSIGAVPLTGHQRKSIEVFNAVVFFKKQLQKEEKKYNWAEKIENILLFLLFALAMIAIIFGFNI
jgi:hypothetical protein